MAPNQDTVTSAVLSGVRPFPEPVADSSWLIAVEGFDPQREQDCESWFTVANGRTGTRGSLEEITSHSLPATYVAGVYAWPEDEHAGPELMGGPEWVRLELLVGGDPVDFDWGEVLELRRVLDMRQGIVFCTWHHRLPWGVKVSFRSARFASLADRAMLGLIAVSDCEEVTRFTKNVPLSNTMLFDRVEMLRRNGWLDLSLQGHKGGFASFAISTEGGGASVERLVAVSRGAGETEAGEVLASARSRGAHALIQEHCEEWAERWRSSDVVIAGDTFIQKAMRFAIYHLISSADPESDRASVGARGLTGPGYRGHVFWDTEVFALPFFIYTHPPTARALLAYRYRTLPGARRKATQFGYEGAMYPWESADTGDEVTPPYVSLRDGTRIPVLTAREQHHISADVAWATYRYWQATHDERFLAEMGAEILLETARFWASRVSLGADHRYHIEQVMGPDEYHEGVSDNAFTNLLARWNLQRALEVVEVLRELDPGRWIRLLERLQLVEHELDLWRSISERMADGFNPDTLLFEQFAGFAALEDVRAVDLHPRPFSGELALGVQRLRRSQVIKQADVLMAAHMLPEVMSAEVAEANYRYYEPRCSHGSSLSPAIHASVAARIKDLEASLEYLRTAGGVDLENRMGNASHGVHIATMGGLWQAAVMGLGGFRAEREGLRLDPQLPPGWDRVSFPIQWRGAHVRVEVDAHKLEFELSAPTCVAVGTSSPALMAPGRYKANRGVEHWGELQKA